MVLRWRRRGRVGRRQPYSQKALQLFAVGLFLSVTDARPRVRKQDGCVHFYEGSRNSGLHRVPLNGKVELRSSWGAKIEVLILAKTGRLTGLNAVTWSQYHHAYGPADDVPGLLRALLSDDPARRETAKWELYGNLWHQGAVYEATQHAVPFLVELLSVEGTDKEFLITYLAHLAAGHSFHELHQKKSVYDRMRNTPGFQAKIERENLWVDAATTAVREGRDVFVSHANSDDPMVRIATTFISSRFSDEAVLGEVMLALWKEDEDERVRASALMSLLFFPDHWDMVELGCVELLALEHGSLEKWIAAQVLARGPGEVASKQVVAALLDAIRRPELLRAKAAELPWFQCDVQDVSGLSIPLLGNENLQAVIGDLISLFSEVNGPCSLDIGHGLLLAAFQKSGDHKPFAEMSDIQQEVLRLLAETESVWTFDALERFLQNKILDYMLEKSIMSVHLEVNMGEILKSFRLPDGRDAIRGFMRGEPIDYYR
jgi:hypothetical protein